MPSAQLPGRVPLALSDSPAHSADVTQISPSVPRVISHAPAGATTSMTASVTEAPHAVGLANTSVTSRASVPAETLTVGLPRSPALRRVPAGVVEVVSGNCTALPPESPQGLAITYWFDAALHGDTYSVRVRFTGRRQGAQPGEPRSAFETVRTMEGVVPGSGRVALTIRVPDVTAGIWTVSAGPDETPGPGEGEAGEPGPGVLPTGTATGSSGFLPLANIQAPGVRVGAWPVLVSTAATAAVAMQTALAAGLGLPVGRLLVLAVLACLVGVMGAKTYYVLTHRRVDSPRGLRAGMSVQGFVLASVATVMTGSFLWSVPLGAALDATGPALLLGLTIGRLGCFFGGCCAGRPTASRWGVWSSDRRVGVRRLPVQLMEATLAGVLLMTTTPFVVAGPAGHGWVFVVAVAAYTFGRQLLFPLRGIPRSTRYGRVATLALSGVVSLVATVSFWFA